MLQGGPVQRPLHPRLPERKGCMRSGGSQRSYGRCCADIARKYLVCPLSAPCVRVSTTTQALPPATLCSAVHSTNRTCRSLASAECLHAGQGRSTIKTVGQTRICRMSASTSQSICSTFSLPRTGRSVQANTIEKHRPPRALLQRFTSGVITTMTKEDPGSGVRNAILCDVSPRGAKAPSSS